MSAPPLDGSGFAEGDAHRLSAEYFTRGCLVPHSGAMGLRAPDDALNQNAVFEAARRLSHVVRILARAQVVGYEVGSDGKSVIWFRRYSPYSREIDLFAGIADSIRHVAPKRGVTNEWLLEFHWKAYAPAATNAFKPEAFSDYFSLWNRCLWMTPDVATETEYLWHVSYGARIYGVGNIVSEAPTGWNYGRRFLSPGNLNQRVCAGDPVCEEQNRQFYQSCQIYAPPYEIESAETVASGRDELVKVTLTGRLQNTVGAVGGAPNTIGRDISGWNAATIAAEPRRTDENALRLYLLHTATGYNPAYTVGDQGLESIVHTVFDSVFAAIYPHVQLTKLVPKPYEDRNDTPDADDTPLWHDFYAQMELYLRCMCEGWVDAVSTAARNGCYSTGSDCVENGYDLFDYTYESLNLQAHGGRWMGTLPTSATPRIPEGETRDDAPMGFGPLPNTISSAEAFNKLAAGIDLLTRARVMLPYQMEKKSTLYTGRKAVVDSLLCGGSSGCTEGSGYIVTGESAPAATTLDMDHSDPDWVTVAGPITASTAAAIAVGCADGAYSLGTDREATEFRFRLTDPDSLLAIPIAWRDMIETGAVGTMFCSRTYTWSTSIGTGAGSPCAGTITFGCELVLNETPPTSRPEARCVFQTAGKLDFGALPPSSIYGAAWSIGVMHSDQCTQGSGYTQSLTPLDGRTLYLEVPLIDWE